MYGTCNMPLSIYSNNNKLFKKKNQTLFHGANVSMNFSFSLSSLIKKNIQINNV